MVKDLLSIIIPSRNEPYLARTIQDLLEKSTGKIEIIAVFDGYWPEVNDISTDKRVNYIHFTNPRGMRNAINSGVAISNGEFVMKIDAHCMVEKGFDEVLKRNCEVDWVVVPRRYALDPVQWALIDNPKYPVDYMYLSKDLHGEVWTEKNNDESLKTKEVDELMSAQGSCWFMRREYFNFLELMDEENFGEFSNEFQEIGFKAWLSGGRVVVNKKTWYAHWHKTESRGYNLKKEESEKGMMFTKRWVNERVWHKQTLPFNTMIERFGKLPE